MALGRHEVERSPTGSVLTFDTRGAAEPQRNRRPRHVPGQAPPSGSEAVVSKVRTDPGAITRVELFNLKDDPGERRDLASARPGRVRALRGKLHAWQRDVGARASTPNPRHDPSKPDGRR